MTTFSGSKNRLSKETSPYLKQHEQNPVDWYPWGPEALEKARREDKPILLSVGYSACHWCHVMAHESFESPQTAAIMNAHFINIKVDREERPDIDQIYQTVAQIFTRGGGWPLTVFLTPDLKPFYGGTYFPPADNYGRPGFPRLLQALHDTYVGKRPMLEENAEKIVLDMKKIEAGHFDETENLPPLTPEAKFLAQASESLCGYVDWQDGGFGQAPKFPNVMLFRYLWREGSGQARDAALLSLEKMAKGGIYDQLGGGFHRYSVDGEWSVPHFEKMLHDNGLLLQLYSEVFITAGARGASLSSQTLSSERKMLFLHTIRETADYLLRELKNEDGLFYAAQDADSEGEEGKFFVWDLQDLTEHLSAEEAKAFVLRYGVSPNGNFEHTGKTVLYQAMTVREVSARLGDNDLGNAETTVEGTLNRAKAKLLAVRRDRIAPGTDTKVLVGWNGLAISGLSWASLALRAAGSKEEGERLAQFAREAYQKLKDCVSVDGTAFLSATYQYSEGNHGVAKGKAYLDDYAFLAQAAFDLMRADFTAEADQRADSYIADIEKWIGVVLKHFRDPKRAGYYFTADFHESLIQRPKSNGDQAIPSGTSVVLGVMALLAEGGYLTPEKTREWEREFKDQLERLLPEAQKNAYGQGELLSAAWMQILGVQTLTLPLQEERTQFQDLYFKLLDARTGLKWDPLSKKTVICHRQVCREAES